MTIRVIIVDDQAIIRSGLRMILESSEEFEVVGEAADGADAIIQAKLQQPDIALMDLCMPNMDGICATRKLVQLPNPPHVLVLSTYSSDNLVLDALDAGAGGFLLKDLRCEELLSAMRVIASGGRVFAPELLRNLVRQATLRTPVYVNGLDARVAALSDSERKVLRLIGMGMSNGQIAKELHLASTSVKTYVSRTLAKLGLNNRTQAAVVAYSIGLAANPDDTAEESPAD
ncbi:response regulator [Streptomyces violascens]|uniref:response regulator n=1 Tax=Streptomyces violascens TaxID=67381 RepID=UPI0036906887